MIPFNLKVIPVRQTSCSNTLAASLWHAKKPSGSKTDMIIRSACRFVGLGVDVSSCIRFWLRAKLNTSSFSFHFSPSALSTHCSVPLSKFRAFADLRCRGIWSRTSLELLVQLRISKPPALCISIIWCAFSVACFSDGLESK